MKPVTPISNGSETARATYWSLALLLIIAAVVRFKGLAFGLPYTQARPDETFIIDSARKLLAGDLPRFYDYPWLYIWLVSAGYLGFFLIGLAAGWFHSIADMLASWVVHWQPFFLIGRVISASVGSLSVLIVYRLGRQLRDQLTGLVSALFLAVSFIHARDSHFGTTDILMTALILGAVSVLLDAHQTPRSRTFGWAGLVAGLAMATKYNGVVLGATVATSWIIHVGDRKTRRMDAILDVNLVWFAIPCALGFLVGVPFIALDHAAFLDSMGRLVDSMRIGDPRLALSNGWVHHLQYSLRYGMGLPLLLAGLGGIPVLLRRQPRLGAVFLSFPVAYYIIAGSIRNLFFRYTLPIVPFLDVTAAYLLCSAAQALVARLAVDLERRRHAATLVTAGLAIALALPAAVSLWQFDRVISATDNRVVVAQWFEQHVPSGSSVLQSGSQFGHARFDLRLGYKEWRWDGPRRLFLENGRQPTGQPEWILLQDSPLPSATQDVVTTFLRSGYEPVTEFKAVSLSDDLVYDRQDAFFVPFNGFDRVERPGPNFSLFRRNPPATERDAPVEH